MLDLIYIALRQWKFVVIAALGLYIGWLKLQNAHIEAKLADALADVKTLSAEVVAAQKAVAQAKNVNEQNVQQLDRAKADQAEIVRALEREIARIKDEKQQVQVVRKVIRERVESCPPQPLPPGIGAAREWLRDHPDSPRGPDGNSLRAPGATAVAPRLPDRAAGPVR